MARPDLEKVPSFYHNYIRQVAQDDLQQAFDHHLKDFTNVLETVPEEKWNYRYAPDKWTIKELVLHVIDSERIFGYRALCIARGETTSLPGFDENTYAANSKAEHRTKESLLKELKAVQAATALLFRSFDEEQLQQSGIANGKPITVNAIGFIVVGHTLHHKNILKERYL